MSTVLEDKNKEKEAGNGPVKKLLTETPKINAVRSGN